MLYSMTGYGKATVSIATKTISIEIKSLNSKYLDINIRLPQSYKEKEMLIRQKLAKQLFRGKVDVYILVEEFAANPHYAININTIKSYYAQLSQVCDELQAPKDNLISTVMAMPDTTKVERPSITPSEWAAIQEVLAKAVVAFKDFRQREGSVLEQDFATRINNIVHHLSDIKTLAPQRIQRVRKRVEEALVKLWDKQKVDMNRFEQELIFYLEKLDINEEIVRLENHCQYFLTELAAQVEVKGKKLSFIAQEIGREINTIGAKANDAPIQTLVVKMKDELEKIREQVMNSL